MSRSHKSGEPTSHATPEPGQHEAGQAGQQHAAQHQPGQNTVVAPGIEIVEGYAGSSLSDDLKRLAESVNALGKRVKKQPYPYLGAAAAVGFVLGGGLWGRLGRLLLTVGARAAFAMLSKQALQLAEAQLKDTASSQPAHGG